MSLSGVEDRVISTIAARQSDLLHDLEVLVALPTGGGNKPALDETRTRLCTRLKNSAEHNAHARIVSARMALRETSAPPSPQRQPAAVSRVVAARCF